MKTLEIKSVDVDGRQLLDFVISGRPLLREMRKRGIPLVPALMPGLTPVDVSLRDQLLLETAGNMRSGRVALYIDPSEGDPQYWAVGPRIEQQGGDIVWFDFAQEENLIEEVVEPLDRLGPFRFNKEDYRKALNIKGRPLGT